MELNDKLSTNFTFGELTRTDVRDLLDENREKAAQEMILRNLKLVCSELLEPIRALFKKPIFVSSGYRFPELNTRIGGSQTSQHRFGEAVDIVIKGYETHDKQVEAVKRIIKELPKLKWNQLLIEGGCLHISLGTKKYVGYYSVKDKKKIEFTV